MILTADVGRLDGGLNATLWNLTASQDSSIVYLAHGVNWEAVSSQIFQAQCVAEDAADEELHFSYANRRARETERVSE